MLILLSAVLFGFGLMLFSLGVAVWLLGLAIRIVLWLVRLGLMIALAISAAHADWRERAKEAVAPAAENEHQPCPLYASPEDGRLHVRIPVCFYLNGDVYMESQDGYLVFNNRKAGALHPAVKCAGIVETAERVDPRTFLVRVFCQGATPERETLSVQLIDGTIHIFNVETN
jgi:hypothetical protein